jgi:succinyl-CoA synthetase beta subunit
VTVNDDALGRHEDLATLTNVLGSDAKTAIAPPVGLDVVELEGTIAILGNGAGLTMSTLDLVNRAGGKPAMFLNVGAECRYDYLGSSFPDRISQGLETILQNKNVRAVLVNILANVTPCGDIAEAITTFLQQHSYGKSVPPIVMRMIGPDATDVKDGLEAVDIPLFEHLEDAIARTVALSKSHK